MICGLAPEHHRSPLPSGPELHPHEHACPLGVREAFRPHALVLVHRGEARARDSCARHELATRRLLLQSPPVARCGGVGLMRCDSSMRSSMTHAAFSAYSRGMAHLAQLRFDGFELGSQAFALPFNSVCSGVVGVMPRDANSARRRYPRRSIATLMIVHPVRFLIFMRSISRSVGG